MSNVQIVDAFVGETWRDGGGFFFGFAEEDGEVFDRGHGNVSSVVTGEEGLALEVEEEEGGCHGEMCRLWGILGGCCWEWGGGREGDVGEEDTIGASCRSSTIKNSAGSPGSQWL